MRKVSLDNGLYIVTMKLMFKSEVKQARLSGDALADAWKAIGGQPPTRYLTVHGRFSESTELIELRRFYTVAGAHAELRRLGFNDGAPCTEPGYMDCMMCYFVVEQEDL